MSKYTQNCAYLFQIPCREISLLIFISSYKQFHFYNNNKYRIKSSISLGFLCHRAANSRLTPTTFFSYQDYHVRGQCLHFG